MLVFAGTPAAVTGQPCSQEPAAWRVRHSESPHCTPLSHALLRGMLQHPGSMHHPRGQPAARWALRRPLVPHGGISEASGVWSSRFAGLIAARPRSPPASQDGPWGEGDDDAAPAEPGGFHGPPGAQPQPGSLVQTCLLRDLKMSPLTQTQTLRDFEQVRPRGAGTHQRCQVLAGYMMGATVGCGGREVAGRAIIATGRRVPPRPPPGRGARGPPGLGFHRPSPSRPVPLRRFLK